MRKQLLGVAVLLAAGAAIAHLHASSQSYHPVIRIAAPGNTTYTAVLPAVGQRPACSSAGRTFVEPLRAQCPECEVLSARCERELEGLELALSLDAPLPLHVVRTPAVRMAIEGERALAKAACDYIAGDALRRGAADARCLLPQGKKG